VGAEENIMKRMLIRLSLVMTLLSVLVASMATISSAQGLPQFGATVTPSATPPIPPAAGAPVQVVDFLSLGVPDTTLTGPYDSMTVDFSLPPNWRLLDGTEVRFLISAYSASTNAGETSSEFLGATLDVRFNNKVITSLALKPGTNEYRVKIPVNALLPARSDQRYTLYLFLNAAIDCEFQFHKTTVVVGGDSQFILPYAEVSISPDLGHLPLPFYQRNAIFPIASAIVVPDSPSADELRAAMIVSAAFGRMSAGRISMTLLSQSQVTPEIQSTQHLIFVGKPAALSMLSSVQWPAALAGNALSSAGMQADDGIIQMANSPWNAGRMLLWVGGNTDVGVLKAAQALSSGDLKPLLERDKVIIADVQPFLTAPLEESLKTPPDRKFSELGYDIRKVDGVGFKQLDYTFYISPGLVPSEKPYIDLTFNNSALLDPSTSSMVVYVNGVQIASERLSEDTSVLSTKRLLIPENLVRMGENQISVQANLFPITACSLFTFNTLWLTIYPESVLHLPLMTAPASVSQAASFKDYPGAFISYPTLKNIGFVLPKNNVTAWRSAAQIAFDLGQRVHGAVLEMAAFYDDEFKPEDRGNYDLFIVGLPASLTTIAELKDKLPVPFEQGNNLAVIRSENVVYRAPDNISLGYLELLPSPWGAAHALVAVLGSNEEGLTFAANGLTFSDLRARLFGNFAVVTATEVLAADTNTGAGVLGLTTGAAPFVTPQVTLPTPLPHQLPRQSLMTRTDYIPFAIAVMLILLVVILFLGLRSSRKNKGG